MGRSGFPPPSKMPQVTPSLLQLGASQTGVRVAVSFTWGSCLFTSLRDVSLGAANGSQAGHPHPDRIRISRSVSAKTGPASGLLAVRVSAPGRHKVLTVVRGGSQAWV